MTVNRTAGFAALREIILPVVNGCAISSAGSMVYNGGVNSWGHAQVLDSQGNWRHDFSLAPRPGSLADGARPLEPPAVITVDNRDVGKVKAGNLLDLTDPAVVRQMKIDSAKLTARVDDALSQKKVYRYTNDIANQAYDAGSSGIAYPSSRKSGSNAVMLFSGR